MRKSWPVYFMTIAEAVAERSTCLRKSVGAVITFEHKLISTGYNGSIAGMPHCSETGCMMEDNHCVATIHAEVNALIQAGGLAATRGATIYTTASPCWPCFKQIANAGIKEIIYKEFYRDERIFDVAATLGIVLKDIKNV